MQVLFEMIVQIKQKRGVGVENPSPRSFSGGGVLHKELQCVAVCYSVLQCVAVCCSVMQCNAVCCSVLQCVHHMMSSARWRCVAVWCSVLQGVAVCSPYDV